MGETTNFLDDSFVRASDARTDMLDSSMATNVSDAADVRMFLAKPILVETGTIPSTTAINGVVESFNIADQLTSTTNRVWFNKLTGYNMYRGTAVVRLVVNAQPFQAGRLLLHCLPQAEGYNGYSATYENNHTLNLNQTTQHPCVEMDIHDASVELRIPFVSPTLWYARNFPYGWGKIYLRVLSPINSAAANFVGYSLFLSFDDFELCAPIYGPEGGKKRNNVAKASIKESMETSRKGIVSSTLTAVSDAATALINIPLIGDIAKGVASVGGSLANIAKYFGWNKPTYSGTEQIVTVKALTRAFNSDGVNSSEKISLDSMNALPVLDGFAGVNFDEMSFSYLKKIPAYFTHVTVSTSDVAGTAIYSQNISPRNCCVNNLVTYTAITNTVYTAAPFAYMARYFMYWRGSIEMTIKIVKTQFHTGRYAILFTPVPNGSTGTPTNLYQQSYVYREVIDIREHQEITLKLPYMVCSNFLNTNMVGDLTNPQNFVSGAIQIVPINPLVATSTVASNIEFLIYFNGGDDFELAGNVANNYSPTLVAQIGDEGIELACKPIGGAPQPALTMLPCSTSIGESFSSLKQLISPLRYCSGNLNGTCTTEYYGTTVTFYPFFLQLGLVSDTITNKSLAQWLGEDIISELSTGYVLSRGGLRYAIPCSSSSANIGGFTAALILAKNAISWLTLHMGASITPVVQAAPPVQNDLTSAQNGALVAGTSIYHLFDFTVPHLMKTPTRLNYISCDTYGANTTVIPSLAAPCAAHLPDAMDAMLRLNITTIKNGQRLMRGGADDFALGYFIGFFPFALS